MEGLPEKRILIYGVSGAGKTTFARDLSERIGIPWHSVDDLTWLPGWQQVSDDQQRERIQKIVDGEEWIPDTAYGKLRDIPTARAQLIIGLDYSRTLTLWRLVRRTLKRTRDKELICNGNIESWKIMLSKDSLILWHFQSFSRKRERMRAWARNQGGQRVILFSRPREAEAWLQTQSQ